MSGGTVPNEDAERSLKEGWDCGVTLFPRNPPGFGFAKILDCASSLRSRAVNRTLYEGSWTHPIETKNGAFGLHFLFQEREGFEPSVL